LTLLKSKAQNNDKFVPQPSNTLKLEKRKLPNNDVKLLGDISTDRFRPLIPENFRRLIFDRLPVARELFLDRGGQDRDRQNWKRGTEVYAGIDCLHFLAPYFSRLCRLVNLSHSGIKATRRPISDRFVWRDMKKDIDDWCRTCLTCHQLQQTKINRHPITPLQHFETPDARFVSVCIDIVGPLNESNGYSYILTAIDQFTRWPKATTKYYC